MAPKESRFTVDALGHRLVLSAAPGLFSADRLDDGTRLLLDNLPARVPKTVLDLGCGAGALGLPIAAANPEAHLLLVDRDLLAVQQSESNARALGLGNVECRGSLGMRDVGPGPFDWILSNIPARIGGAAIASFAAVGAARLAPGGELRFVVIRDLGPVVEAAIEAERLDGRLAAEGARHLVFAIAPKASASPAAEDEAIYLHDKVPVAGLELERPADISEDPRHLGEGLPLLLSCLPSKPGKRALVWRGSYGPAALTLARRGSAVTAADRDLLALAFTRRNATSIGVTIEIRPVARAGELSEPPFDLIVAEAQPAFGERGVAEEWRALAGLLKPGGEALLLASARLTQAVLRAGSVKGLSLLAEHGGWAVARLRPMPKR
jgi:16S rRNA G1207 methylase RsmC